MVKLWESQAGKDTYVRVDSTVRKGSPTAMMPQELLFPKQVIRNGRSIASLSVGMLFAPHVTRWRVVGFGLL
jgi:hypothetical protein